MMARSQAPESEREQELRARILAGSQNLQDYNALADILLSSPGREGEGVAILESALRLTLSGVEKGRLCADIAWFLYELGHAERAAEMAQEALSLAAGEREGPEVLLIKELSHATLANVRYSVGEKSAGQDAQLAIEAFERLLWKYPHFDDIAAACRYCAGVHILRGEHAKAAALYEEAIRRDPSDPNRLYALAALGDSLICQARFDEAERCLRGALEHVESDRRLTPRIHFGLGKLYRSTGREKEAAESFRSALGALGLNPALLADAQFVAEIKWELANLVFARKSYAEASLLFREAIPHLPAPYPYFDALVCLGHCYLATGEYARARDCYEEVLASQAAAAEERATAREGLSRIPPFARPKAH